MSVITIKELMAVVVAGCLLAAVHGCHKETEQDRIKKVITSLDAIDRSCI